MVLGFFVYRVVSILRDLRDNWLVSFLPNGLPLMVIGHSNSMSSTQSPFICPKRNPIIMTHLTAHVARCGRAMTKNIEWLFVFAGLSSTLSCGISTHTPNALSPVQESVFSHARETMGSGCPAL